MIWSLIATTISFNPRTHEGCDGTGGDSGTVVVSFNPRTHEGCDAETEKFSKSQIVSIHAPTRGATFIIKFNLIIIKFQSTHPRGVRPPSHFRPLLSAQFQSTHPRGVRRRVVRCLTFAISFNPRTHEGCDLPFRWLTSISQGFNPRTHEGCDCLLFYVYRVTKSFNPRTHEGCDLNDDNAYYPMAVSIHAPTRGATANIIYLHKDNLFQSTHPRGVRHLFKIMNTNRGKSFNPRTHEGCDQYRT